MSDQAMRQAIGGIVRCTNCYSSIANCSCGETRTQSQDGAICPYCARMNRARESDGVLFDESTTSYDCGSCGKSFDVAIHITYQWTAYRGDDQ